tara:strand:- start:17 stop:373 length:357 start_codon:yes stop_codon:yes gene_type:complete
MNESKLKNINELIKNNKIDQAQNELSKLGHDYYKDTEYLYLRSKIFFINKLYYLAVDTLLIALEFKENEKIYNLISKIYKELGNKELSKKIGDPNLRLEAIATLKSELTGISQKGYDL